MYASLLHRLFDRLRVGRLHLEEGRRRRSFGDPASSLEGTLVVHDPAFYREVARGGEAGLGRSYTAGHWSSPDLENVTLILNLNVADFTHAITGGGLFAKATRLVGRAAQRVLAARKRSTPEGSRHGMSVAYDVGEDFFHLMLGESMLYSCAIFPTAESTLDAAQRHKLDVLIRKLAPEPGHRVLDIGCGWGTLLGEIHARHGCETHGVSLARRQIDHCRETFPEGRFDLLDYRDIEGEELYDRIISVGMIEHVGVDYHEVFMESVARLLKPGGRAVFHTMIEGDLLDLGDGTHIDSYAAETIMPVSYIPSPRELRRAINRCGRLRPIHDERFGQHYGKTMRSWRANVLTHRSEIAKLYSEEHVRVYDYIWGMSSGCFLSSNFDLLQLVVEKGPLDNDIRVYDPR